MHLSGPHGVDRDGWIVPEVALDRLDPIYAPVVADLRSQCRSGFGADLHSLYLAGSLVKGTARLGVSDVDALAVLHVEPGADHEARATAIAEIVDAHHPIIAGVTLGLFAHDRILSAAERYDMGFCLKCLLVCIDGDDLANQLPRYQPTVALARGTNGNIRRLLEDRRTRLQETTDPAIVAAICRGIMRKIVRTGFTLVMPRYSGWTSEITPAAEIFAAYYPDQRRAMVQAAQLAITPSGDRDLVVHLLETLGTWLADEYDREIMGRQPGS